MSLLVTLKYAYRSRTNSQRNLALGQSDQSCTQGKIRQATAERNSRHICADWDLKKRSQALLLLAKVQLMAQTIFSPDRTLCNLTHAASSSRHLCRPHLKILTSITSPATEHAYALYCMLHCVASVVHHADDCHAIQQLLVPPPEGQKRQPFLCPAAAPAGTSLQ